MSRTKASCIALLSDFGLEDIYVGVMKGAIASINPEATMIDISHRVKAQDIRSGNFCLTQAYPYFPVGTIYLAVVDPGVGSSRKAIAIAVKRGYLVGPDNGVFTGIIQQGEAIAAVNLTETAYWGKPDPSHTFHGRDIFAPVAAHLSQGVPLSALGANLSLEDLVVLPPLHYQTRETGVEGEIEYIDHFGNLITNIPGVLLPNKTWSVVLKDLTIPGVKTYQDVPPGEILALIGSHGQVEISINGGNAQAQLKLTRGDQIKIIN